MSFNINDKIKRVEQTKAELFARLKDCGIDITKEATFRSYKDYIKDIVDSGVMTYEELDIFTEEAIDISGEKA